MAATFLIPPLLFLLCLQSEAASTPNTTTQAGPSIQTPHFTGCLSREQETFRCWWTPGMFQNLSEPGQLRVFYQTKSSNTDWLECPEYTPTVRNECYFNRSYTTVWTGYCVELRSPEDNITHDKYCFRVENIVHPDPPVALNWTLLNVSLSGLNYDIMVRWEPPPSADVQGGWMTLVYEVHYRKRKSSHWNTLELEYGTHQSIYGLHTDSEYEVRVRCKMRAFENFGEFSDGIFVHVAQIPSKESSFPVTVVLIFGGVAILLILVLFSQQQRLMIILLPPVPAPKINGIDSDLLKKGKLDELDFFLSSQAYHQDYYREETCVEFIDVDDLGEKGDMLSDTERLLGLGHFGSCHTLSSDNHHSGRNSCCDPDALSVAQLLPGQPDKEERPLVVRTTSFVAALEADPQPPVQSARSWVNTDFYAQVSDVTPAGGVVLSPGQQSGVTEQTPRKKKMEQDSEEEEEPQRRKEKVTFQLLVVDLGSEAYAAEMDGRHLSSSFSPGDSYHTLPTQHAFGPAPIMSPYILADSAPAAPVSDYTVVQDVDAQHSLLLNPSVSRVPCSPPPPPTKPLPAIGYLSPDLLGNLLP